MVDFQLGNMMQNLHKRLHQNSKKLLEIIGEILLKQHPLISLTFNIVFDTINIRCKRNNIKDGKNNINRSRKDIDSSENNILSSTKYIVSSTKYILSFANNIISFKNNPCFMPIWHEKTLLWIYMLNFSVL